MRPWTWIPLALVCATVLIGRSALAAAEPQGRKVASPQPKYQDLSIDVPQSDLFTGDQAQEQDDDEDRISRSLAAPLRTQAVSEETLSAAGPSLEVATSSWMPRNLSMSSQVEDATAYEGVGLPEMSLSFYSGPIWRHGRLKLVGLAGLSLLKLRREGTTHTLGIAESVEQDLYFVPARLGVEGGLSLSRSWSVFASAALCPTILATERSVFDDGRTRFGVPLELSFGVANDLRWMSQRLTGFELRVGGVATVGRFDSVDFSGTGVRAGLSVPL